MRVGQFFSFEGRIGVGAYWGITALFWAAVIVVSLIAMAVAPPLLFIALPVAAWVSLATIAKRCHDRGKSAWFQLIALIPIVGQLWLVIEMGFLPGSETINRFGLPGNGSPFTSDDELVLQARRANGSAFAYSAPDPYLGARSNAAPAAVTSYSTAATDTGSYKPAQSGWPVSDRT